MKNWIVVFLIFALPLCVFAWLESGSNKSVAKEARNNTVAKGEAPMTSSKTVNFGKPKMLKFSSPMCSDCKKVAGELVKVVPDYEDAVTFEEINVTDGSKESAAMVKDYKVTVVPTMVFIGKDGKIARKIEGFLTETEIRNHLDTIK